MEIPDSRVYLAPGERYDVKAMVEHRVVNPSADVARYLLVQHGIHDFIEMDVPSSVRC